MAYGTARSVEDEQELQVVINKLLNYYGKADRVIPRARLLETGAIVLEVTKMTARRELEAKQTEFYEWERQR
jgi:hypothetical protein